MRGMLEALGECNQDIEDKKLINSMITSTTDIIHWLETGRSPYYEQGIDINSAYHVQHLSNMDLIPDITEQITQEREPLTLTSEQKRVIKKVFDALSDRERDCFILHEARGLSMSQVGDQLGIAKTTVQNHVENARRKVKNIQHGTNMVRIHNS